MTSNAQLLAEMVRQVRDHTIHLLRATPQGWLTWAPPGTNNHVLWHAGHALWLLDELWVRRVTGQSELPSGWSEAFGMQCRPPGQTRKWPAASEMDRRLTDQRQRLIELLEEVPAAQLIIPATKPARGWDLVRGLIHGLHDEARHNGEMYLILKLCRSHQ